MLYNKILERTLIAAIASIILLLDASIVILPVNASPADEDEVHSSTYYAQPLAKIFLHI